MIRARYAEKSQEVEVEADQIGLAALSTLLSDGRGTIEASIPHMSAAPYHGYLGQIQVKPGEGLVSISRQDESLNIQGSSEALAVLARIFDSLIEGWQENSPATIRRHVHIEGYEGHSCLAGISAPLVLLPPRLLDSHNSVSKVDS